MNWGQGESGVWMGGSDLQQLFGAEERDGIAPALLEEQRRMARAAVIHHDTRRLRMKGVPEANQMVRRLSMNLAEGKG